MLKFVGEKSERMWKLRALNIFAKMFKIIHTREKNWKQNIEVGRNEQRIVPDSARQPSWSVVSKRGLMRRLGHREALSVEEEDGESDIQK